MMATVSSANQNRLRELSKWTPLATVLQNIVDAYLKGPTTLFVADSFNHVVRAVSLEDFSVLTFAGKVNCKRHRDGTLTEARFDTPFCLSVHAPSGSLLVGECSSQGCSVRCVAANKVVSLNPTGARLHVSGIVVVGNDVFVSDFSNHCIRKHRLASASFTLFAGQPGARGFADSPNAQFNNPAGLTTANGSIFVTDYANHSLRMVAPDGKVSTLAGCGERGYLDGLAAEAKFSHPTDCAYDGHGNVLVVDQLNHCIRSVNLATNTVSTLTGRRRAIHKDGDTSIATFSFPRCIVVDKSTGAAYVSSNDQTVRRISDGKVTTVCGTAGVQGHEEGKFCFPVGLALL